MSCQGVNAIQTRMLRSKLQLHVPASLLVVDAHRCLSPSLVSFSFAQQKPTLPGGGADAVPGNELCWVDRDLPALRFASLSEL